ncbi:hypothetical protein G1C97_0459 [Bifidobacterium sp. DSM 109959]|uniref:Uncharacterized protein n=1 Tax=Bifidobacterium olomucense TaxID=2675324 RepID=A0A7Y0EW36_9BIFI|nr:hypothetical protein [Bifidobacterium sp. DSM 109959]
MRKLRGGTRATDMNGSIIRFLAPLCLCFGCLLLRVSVEE